jgi:hypothetical protein
MAETLNYLGVQWRTLDYIPFKKDLIAVDFFEPQVTDGHEVFDDNVVVYGSINLLQYVSKNMMGWQPGAGVSWNKYRCSAYYPAYCSYLFNNSGDWYPVEWLIKNFDELIPVEGFIRPDEATKSFKGGRYNKRDFLKAISGLEDDFWVYVDTPTNPHDAGEIIQKEYRIFCCRDQVITGSQYRENETKKVDAFVPDAAYEFVTELLRTVQYFPDDVFAVDIAEVCDEFYLLELSPWACAGLYACDVSKLVTAVCEHYSHHRIMKRKVF